MLYSILDEMIKSQYLNGNEKFRLIQIKTEVKEKEEKQKRK